MRTRKAIAVIVMLALMAIYAVAVTSMSGLVNSWTRWAQLAFYVLAGVAWVFPLKPVIDWMNRGPMPDPEDD